MLANLKTLGTTTKGLEAGASLNCFSFRKVIRSALRMRPAFPLLRAILLVVAFAACLVPFRSRIASANDNQKDKKELKARAEALLAKSHGLSNIEAPGSPAFALNAKIHYQLGTQTAEGDGQIIWMAPDHYRETYTAPHYFYIEVARDGYRYFSRTNDEMPFLMYELRTAVDMTMQPLPKEKERVQGVSSGELTCISFKPPSVTHLCLDDNGDISKAEYRRPSRSSVASLQYEFSDFAQFGAKRFPQKIVFRGGDGHTIELDVTQLAFMKDAGADVFKIPIPSTRETWCAEPKEDRTVEKPIWIAPPGLPDRASAAMRFAGAVLYCIVRPSGRLRSASVIYSSKPIDKKILDEWTASARFATLTCGTDGIEYQLLIDYNFIY